MNKKWTLYRFTSAALVDLVGLVTAVPRRVWHQWGIRMLIGWVVCALVTTSVTVGARHWEPRGLGDWDRRTIAFVEAGPMSFADAVIFESPGNLIYMIPVVIAVAFIATRLRRPVFAVTAVLSYLLARTLVLLGWYVWDRPRPKLIAEGVASPGLHSFPSGHIVLALSVYGLIAYAWWSASSSRTERALAVAIGLAWCASLGYARVRLGAHWPSDVIGGAVVGCAWVGTVVWALRAADNIAPAINEGCD